jgi:hypothetical protein
VQLAGAAAISDDTAEEDDPEYAVTGKAYWSVLDRISIRLGGPAHPGLGYDR